jgi:hypothetical protein
MRQTTKCEETTEERKNIRPTNDKTHKAPYPLTSSKRTYVPKPSGEYQEAHYKTGHYKASTYDRSPYRNRHHLKENTAILIFTLTDKHKHVM